MIGPHCQPGSRRVPRATGTVRQAGAGCCWRIYGFLRTAADFWKRWGLIAGLLACAHLSGGRGGLAAAEENSLGALRAALKADLLYRHVEVLADDSLEGREAGERGGQAAAGYLRRQLEDAGVAPGGTEGGYFQLFGRGYRNVIGVLPGQDHQLRDEYVVVSAHYDHVGYGNRRNSNGPIGYIHNGADDNASGTATLIELARALDQLNPGPRRSILLVFWDAEEKGLLGSEHWVAHPTVPLSQVKLMINMDMVGRLRGNRLEVVGTRTAAGLREFVSRCNVDPNLTLGFPWLVTNNSDHYSFIDREIPSLLIHTGLHDDYHRPSDDVEKLNRPGMEQVARFLIQVVVEATERDELPTFRARSRQESSLTQGVYDRPAAEPLPRLGIAWNPDDQPAGIVVRAVDRDSPADRAGLRPGDVIVGVQGQPLSDPHGFAAIVQGSPRRMPVSVRRADAAETAETSETVNPTWETTIELRGEPIRWGLSWRANDGEPQVATVSRVVAGSAAENSGLYVGDRIYDVNGKRFRDSEQLHSMFDELWEAGEGHGAELLIERDGQLMPVTIRPTR